ncbi:MAG TPA: hypothetical protein VGM76_16735 [Lacipirellulaceae bacterium]
MHCRLIIDPPAAGAWNMAVDEALLLAAAEEDIATFRFYEWIEPTLSLGYFQRYEDRQGHAASRQCVAVRRQSGGGAILHDRELTYCLALPCEHPWARDTQKLYATVHQSIVRQLKRCLVGNGIESALSIFCPVLPKNISKSRQSAGEPFLCFQRRAPGDVVITPQPPSKNADRTAEVWKIVGSAQRRHRGAVLQHGSILLARSPAAPELPGYFDLTGTTITGSTLASALLTEVGEILGLPLKTQGLPASVSQAAREIARDKYGSDSWTRRR